MQPARLRLVGDWHYPNPGCPQRPGSLRQKFHLRLLQALLTPQKLAQFFSSLAEAPCQVVDNYTFFPLSESLEKDSAFLQELFGPYSV